MPKISDRPLTRCHIRLWQDDYDAIQEWYGGTPLGPTGAIREIVSAAVRQIRARAQREIDQTPNPEAETIDLTSLESAGE